MNNSKKIIEQPNFVLKQSAGREKKSNKDRKYCNDGLRIVENIYNPNVKYGINSLVEEALDEYEDFGE